MAGICGEDIMGRLALLRAAADPAAVVIGDLVLGVACFEERIIGGVTTGIAVVPPTTAPFTTWSLLLVGGWAVRLSPLTAVQLDALQAEGRSVDRRGPATDLLEWRNGTDPSGAEWELYNVWLRRLCPYGVTAQYRSAP